MPDHLERKAFQSGAIIKGTYEIEFLLILYPISAANASVLWEISAAISCKAEHSPRPRNSPPRYEPKRNFCTCAPRTLYRSVHSNPVIYGQKPSNNKIERGTDKLCSCGMLI